MKRTSPNFAAILAASALLFSTTFVHAQNQPADAANSQDEIVNVNLGPDEGLDRVLQILRSNDKFETNRYISKAFELKHTSAYELKPFINDVITREKGFVRGAKTVPTDGSPVREFLVVTTTPEQLASIEATIASLDIHGFVNGQGRTRQAIRVKYRRASDLARILTATRGTSQTKLFADDLTNTLYYDDSAYVMKAIEPFVEFFDVPVPQIEFDIQIIEISENNSSKVGLDWDAWKRGIGGQLGFTASNFEGGSDFARLDTLLTLEGNVLASFLNYTTQTGSARLVQRSRLNSSNLEPAVISDTKRVPAYDYTRIERAPALLSEANDRVDTYREYDDRDDTRGEGIARTVTIVPPVYHRLTELTPDKEGLVITIQPVIGVETVTAKINIGLNTFGGFDRNDRPIVTEQKLDNLFTLQNEAQILLGTLERQTVVEGRRGIPGLKEIPVLKYLFSVETRRTDRSRLFILATPKFNNVGFNARTLTEVRNKVQTLNLQPADIVLEDGAVDSAADLVR